MSYVSLSGLSAAQMDLNTTSNNIATPIRLVLKSRVPNLVMCIPPHSLLTRRRHQGKVCKRPKWHSSSTRF